MTASKTRIKSVVSFCTTSDSKTSGTPASTIAATTVPPVKSLEVRVQR